MDRAVNNVFVNGACKNCDSKEKDEGVTCLFCKNLFHAIKCVKPGQDGENIFPDQSFARTWKPALDNKDGSWSKRPGHITFVCSPCLTVFETNQAQQDDDNMDRMNKRMDDFNAEMSGIKDLIVQLTTKIDANQTTSNKPSTSTYSPPNPWHDPEKVKQSITMKPSSPNDSIPEDHVGKLLAGHGIQFQKTMQVKGNTKIILPNKTTAAKAKDVLDAEYPSNHVEIQSPRLPTVNIVGYDTGIDELSVVQELETLNPSISAAIQLDKSTNEKSIEILAIKPLKNKASLARANVRVSNNIRRAIASQGNRVFSSKGSLKVYDSFHVKRCYKCQSFGHIAIECTDNHVCGTCSEEHPTRGCSSKTLCCVNCKKAGHPSDHSAFDSSCLSYIKEQKKIQNSIKYHQKNL